MLSRTSVIAFGCRMPLLLHLPLGFRRGRIVAEPDVETEEAESLAHMPRQFSRHVHDAARGLRPPDRPRMKTQAPAPSHPRDMGGGTPVFALLSADAGAGARQTTGPPRAPGQPAH